jgi:hypothetical protein
MKVAKWFPFLAVSALLVGGIVWAVVDTAPVRTPQPQAAEPQALHGFATNASCSSRGCHGRDEPLTGPDVHVQQNEYTFSVMHDKHTRAYAVLREHRANEIAKNLAPTNKDGAIIPAHEDARCLACHATPQSAWEFKPGTKDLNVLNWQTAGVACEACHGPASVKGTSWLAEHTSTEWGKKPAAEKYQLNYWDLSDLTVQAKVCAGCHVGASADEKNRVPARDCNHDILAAGHPRLNFELNVFRQNLPPHWDVVKKGHDKQEYQARAWAVGRAVAARSSLELLQARADHAEKTKERWPEFAEYRCYSCHTDLNPGWRDVQGESLRARGSFPHDSWYSTLLPSWNPELKGYDRLTSEMAKPWPNPQTVKTEAGQLIKVLDAWAAKLNRDGVKPAEVLSALKENVKESPHSWEDAMQLALAIVALEKADAASLFEPLTFPAKIGEGPRGIDVPASRVELKKVLQKNGFFK